MLVALFGIGNDTLNLVVNLLVLSLVVVYFALVVWTYFDARRRIEDSVLVASSVGASFVFPFIGTVVYSILRPPDYLEDVHEREVEIRAAELRVRHLTEQSCPKCEYPIDKTFLRCPSCRARLKDPCSKCGKPVDSRWAMCPYCEAPIGRPASERRPASREGKASREAKPAREGKPEGKAAAREGKAGRDRPTREQRRPAASGDRGASKQGKRSGSGERRKTGASSPQRTARTGSGDGKEESREAKPQAASRASGGEAPGEERPRPAPAS